MKIKQLPSLDYLQKALDYDSITGGLLWRQRPRKHFNSTRGRNAFNTRSAGKPAGAWHKRDAYLRVQIQGSYYQASRICYYMAYGVEPPPDKYVVTINGDNRDLRASNLKLSEFKNNPNRTGTGSGNAKSTQLEKQTKPNVPKSNPTHNSSASPNAPVAPAVDKSKEAILKLPGILEELSDTLKVIGIWLTNNKESAE